MLPVERVAVLCRFLDITSVTKNHLLKYSLAHAFCCFLAAVEDVNPAVATRARLLLDAIKRPALQVSGRAKEDSAPAPVLHFSCHLYINMRVSAHGSVCVPLCRACVCAWTSSLTRWCGTGPLS